MLNVLFLKITFLRLTGANRNTVWIETSVFSAPTNFKFGIQCTYLVVMQFPTTKNDSIKVLQSGSTFYKIGRLIRRLFFVSSFGGHSHVRVVQNIAYFVIVLTYLLTYFVIFHKIKKNEENQNSLNYSSPRCKSKVIVRL